MIVASFNMTAFGQFIGQFQCITSQESQNGNTRIDTMNYFFGKEKTALIIKAGGNQPDLRLVFSKADSTITGLFKNNGKKGGYILPMNKKYWPAIEIALPKANNTEETFKISSDEKMIDGYVCHYLECTTEEFTGNFWMTPEIPLTLPQILAYSFVGAGEETSELDWLLTCEAQHFILLAEIEDKKRNARITIQIQNIDNSVNDAMFNMEDYSLMDMRKEN